MRWLRYALAAILLLIALILIFLPGPAILFFFLAAALLFPRRLGDVIYEYKRLPREKRGIRAFFTLLKRKKDR